MSTPITARFRSAKLRDLVQEAIRQGFGQKTTGSGHVGIICPRCGVMTVFSTTQKDGAGFKYANQEARLRNHGLAWQGKPIKECAGMGATRSNGDPVIGVFVVTEERYHDRKVFAACLSLDGAKLACKEATGLYDVKGVYWVDENGDRVGRNFGKDAGYLQMFHNGEPLPMRIEWKTARD